MGLHATNLLKSSYDDLYLARYNSKVSFNLSISAACSKITSSGLPTSELLLVGMVGSKSALILYFEFIGSNYWMARLEYFCD